MSLALDDASLRKPIARWTTLPPRMRVLYITTYHRTGGWLAEAFASDSAVDVVLEEAVGLKAGLERLRDEVFDAVLVSHEPGELNALELLDGLRAGGSDEPLIVLGTASEQEMAPLCYEVGADAYVCVNATTTRNLIWTVARAYEHERLLRENRRLSQAEQHRLRLEHQEAQRLLDDQRALLRDLESLGDPVAAAEEPTEADALASSASATLARHAQADEPIPLPPRLIEHYRQLLRTYVIMGSGNLTTEMAMLADLLSAAKVSASQTMTMHLGVVEELVRGLGARSARHVMTRADLLVLEVLMHLSESYRRRLFERRVTLHQQILPGFDEPAPPAFVS